MRKRYSVEVDCANCASKMENAAKKVDGVADVTIAFMTQKMSVTFDDGVDEDAVLADVIAVCKKVEPNFEIGK